MSDRTLESLLLCGPGQMPCLPILKASPSCVGTLMVLVHNVNSFPMFYCLLYLVLNEQLWFYATKITLPVPRQYITRYCPGGEEYCALA